MASTFRARTMAALSLAVLAAHMSGCLAYEIRNDLRQANDSLADVKLRLQTVNDTLLKLERTNTLLSDVDMRLATLESTNAMLSSIDAHLEAMRRAMGNMSISMPGIEPEQDDAAPETDPEADPKTEDQPG